jgi:hypothetical protein
VPLLSKAPAVAGAHLFSDMAQLRVAPHDLIVADSFTKLPGPGNPCPIDAWSKKSQLSLKTRTNRLSERVYSESRTPLLPA